MYVFFFFFLVNKDVYISDSDVFGTDQSASDCDK